MTEHELSDDIGGRETDSHQRTDTTCVLWFPQSATILHIKRLGMRETLMIDD